MEERREKEQQLAGEEYGISRGIKMEETEGYLQPGRNDGGGLMTEKTNDMERRKNEWNHVFEMVTKEEGVQSDRSPYVHSEGKHV